MHSFHCMLIKNCLFVVISREPLMTGSTDNKAMYSVVIYVTPCFIRILIVTKDFQFTKWFIASSCFLICWYFMICFCSYSIRKWNWQDSSASGERTSNSSGSSVRREELENGTAQSVNQSRLDEQLLESLLSQFNNFDMSKTNPC